MKPFSLFIFLLFCCYFIHAQVVRLPFSVRYAGLGAYSKNFVDVFSGTSNPAALAQLTSGAFGVYGERRFMLEEFNQYTSVIALPTTSGTFSVQGDYFGFDSFNESQLGVGYSRSIAKQVNVGVKFNYHTVTVAGYGNATAVNFEAGTIFHLTDRLHTGLHVYNPTSSKLGKNSNEQLAAIFKAGVGYEPSDRLFINTEIIKQEDQPVNVNVGLQYNPQERLFLRGGISTLTNNSYAGVGLLTGLVRIDLNASYHPQLGITHGILLLFNFKKPVKE